MHRVDITPEMIEYAERISKDAYNSNSFMHGGGNLRGFIGEMAVKVAFPDLEYVNEFDYDFLFEGHLKIEVKTKLRTVPYPPPPHFEASITEKAFHQDVDVYIFCNLYKEYGVFKTCHIMGWITKDEFFEKSTYLRKGQPSGDNGYIVKQDCRNIEYGQLNGYDINNI